MAALGKYTVTAALFSLILLQGCSLILGGDQSVDSKSHDYTVHRLDRDSDLWKLITPEKGIGETGDVAFEHESGAVISLNSVCKGPRKMSLQELTRTLFIGLRRTGPAVTRDTTLSGVPALETTVNALTSENKTVRIRAVVLSKASCTYDLMYIAPPQTFDAELRSFTVFLRDFRIED